MSFRSYQIWIIISAVQSYLLKELIFCHKCGDNWRNCDGNNWKNKTIEFIENLIFNFDLEHELNIHFTDCLLSLFINVSSESPKYLVFYEDEQDVSNKDKSSDQDQNQEDNNSHSKRAKLGYDAFTKKLK